MTDNNNLGSDDRLMSLGLSVRAYNYCMRNGIKSVSALIEYYKRCNYSIPTGINAGRTTVNELMLICAKLMAKGFKTSTAQIEFDDIKSWGLSTRAYNYCQSLRITSKRSLLLFYLSNGDSIPPSANVGSKTIAELEEFCKNIISKNPDIISELTAEPFIDNVVEEIDCDLEFSNDENTYITNFQHEHEHLPILWIISNLIEKDLDLTCFAYVYGIDFSKGSKTVSDLSKEMNVTISRIGQRVNKGYDAIFNLPNSNGFRRGYKTQLSKLFCEHNTEYLLMYLKNADIVCSNDTTQKIFAQNIAENTSFCNSFILRLIASFTNTYNFIGDFERNKQNPSIILIKKEVCDIFDFESFIKRFDDYLESITENTIINFREFIEDSPDWLIFSYNNVDRILMVCKQILLSRYGLYDGNCDDLYALYPKKIDLESVVYGIISKASRPLVLSEISEEINKLYPSQHFSDECIRSAIREDRRIQFQRDGGGKTKYLLACMDVPTSVRDAIVRVLDKSEVPVLLDDIVDYVKLHFPTSSKNSVRTTMLNDGRSRFVQFNESRYGLMSKTYPLEYEPLAENNRHSHESRIISLKKFINEKKRFPSINAESQDEISLARWVERNSDKEEVSTMIEQYKPMVWEETCSKCEMYIKAHKGKLPSKEKAPELYKWLLLAADQFKNGELTQSQKKLYLHLVMVIKNRYA